MVLDLENVDVHRAVRDCVEICRDEILVAGLKVSVELAARDHHIEGDYARFMQLFWNLVRNAARFTPGGGRLTIRTCNTPVPIREKDACPVGSRPAQRLVVEFEDTGVGIDMAMRDRIFDPFYQGAVEGRRRSGGLGLGLAIARGIAEAHGGSLSVSSPGLEQGSTFRLELATAPAEATSSPNPISLPTSLPAHSGLSILLVEDNRDTLRYLTLVLEQRGHKVVPVDRVSAALAAAEGSRLDLVISDIELPDGTGHELMRCLGTEGRPPGIAISGFGSEEDVQLSRDAGFAEHLTKPIDLDRLESAVRRVTSKSAGPVDRILPAVNAS
jgi:CheY-like chemotaxis protein